MNADKLKKLSDQVRIGGKGTPRRKKKVVQTTAATDGQKTSEYTKKVDCQHNSWNRRSKYDQR